MVRWWVAASPPVSQTRFELLGSDGSYAPVDFSQSVFAGGINDCKDGRGSCAQYVVRGQYAVAPGARPVQAIHDVYGLLPGPPATTEEVPETIALQSFFHPGNTQVTLNVSDSVGRSGKYEFPRSFEKTMWATEGLCVSDTAPDGVSFSPLDPQTGSLDPPQPLTDSGTYCVATRPIPADQGDSTLLETRIATLPEVVTGTHKYTPPIERSPIMYQLILDLEIPVPDRCTDTIQKLEDITQRAMVGGGVSVHKLPTINLAAEDPMSPCAQTSTRQFASTDIAQAVKELIISLPEVHHQYHMLYFNNLDAPVPSALVNSIQATKSALSKAPDGYELRTFSWLFQPVGPGPASFNDPTLWWAYWPWQTPDKSFELKLAGYSVSNLPYTTQTHDDNKPVPLLSTDDVAAYESENAWIKVCAPSSPIRRWSELPYPHEIFEPTWKITTADPPAYLVTLDTQTVVESSKFVEKSVTIQYQVCTRYCDGHPFLAMDNSGELSWLDTFACASESF